MENGTTNVKSDAQKKKNAFPIIKGNKCNTWQ